MARFREGDPVLVLYLDRAGRVQYRAGVILWALTRGRYRVELDRGDLLLCEDRELWPAGITASSGDPAGRLPQAEG